MPRFTSRFVRRARRGRSRRRTRTTSRRRRRRQPGMHRGYQRRGTLVVRPTRLYRPMFTRLPDIMRVRMKYSEVQNYNPGAGGFSVNQWRLSSIFDPNVTGVGHEPMGSALWGPKYRFYTVVKASYVVTFLSSTGTGADVAAVIFAMVKDDTIFASSLAAIAEQTNIQKMTIDPDGGSNVVTSRRRLKGTVNIQTWTHRDWFARRTVVGFNPSAEDSLYLNTGVYPANLAGDLTGLDLRTEIMYDVIYSGVIEPTVVD